MAPVAGIAVMTGSLVKYVPDWCDIKLWCANAKLVLTAAGNAGGSAGKPIVAAIQRMKMAAVLVSHLRVYMVYFWTCFLL
jgi:hypothetical protein